MRLPLHRCRTSSSSAASSRPALKSPRFAALSRVRSVHVLLRPHLKGRKHLSTLPRKGSRSSTAPSDSGFWRTADSSNFSVKCRVQCRRLRPPLESGDSRTSDIPEDEQFTSVNARALCYFVTFVANTSVLVCCVVRLLHSGSCTVLCRVVFATLTFSEYAEWSCEYAVTLHVT